MLVSLGLIGNTCKTRHGSPFKKKQKKNTDSRLASTYKLGPEVIIFFSCSTYLSMEFFLLVNVKMPTTAGILRFMSRKNNILGLYDPEKC